MLSSGIDYRYELNLMWVFKVVKLVDVNGIDLDVVFSVGKVDMMKSSVVVCGDWEYSLFFF